MFFNFSPIYCELIDGVTKNFYMVIPRKEIRFEAFC